MTFKALTQGAARTGYSEIIRNAKGVDIIGFKSTPDTNNDSGVSDFSLGELALLDGTTPNPLAVKSISGSSEIAAWPVIAGKERSDVRGSKTTALVIGNGYHLRTSGFNPAGTYAYGVPLTVKSGLYTPASSGDYVLALCLTGTYTVSTDAEKALNKTPFQIITVEVGPRGKA